MKKIICIVLWYCLAVTWLTGCGGGGSTASTPDAAPGSTDFNQYLNCQSFYGCTDQGWYIRPYEQIYYFAGDLESAPIPLCAKADCDHSDPNTCSSYLLSGIYAWNNTLYYLDGAQDGTGIALYQMGPDGQDRKVLVNLFPEADNCSYVTNMGGGHLSVALSEYTVNGDVTTLYLVSLADPAAEPAVLFSNEEQVLAAQGDASQIPRPYVMHVGEDWVFYNVESGPTGARSNSLYGYEMDTGETKLLVEDTFFIGGDLSPVGDTLYWYDTDGTTYGRLNKIDLESGAITLVQDIPIGTDVWGTLDNKYLYVSGGSAAEPADLAVYDFEGNEVQRLSCGELGMPIAYAFSDGSRVVFRTYDVGEMMPVCWVDKDKLAEGKAEFHLIETEP